LLKVAPAAAAKIRARRFHADRGRFQNLNNRGESNLALNPINSYAQNIAGRRERDEQRQVVRVRQAYATRQKPFDFNFELLSFVTHFILLSKETARIETHFADQTKQNADSFLR